MGVIHTLNSMIQDTHETSPLIIMIPKGLHGF